MRSGLVRDMPRHRKADPRQAQLELDARPSPSRLQNFADCAAAIDQLFKDALDTDGPGAFDEFLDFVGRFKRLSVYNSMLVRIQRPGAAAVATPRQWLTIGREIMP